MKLINRELQRYLKLNYIENANFGALLLNYFGLKNDKNLKNILCFVSFDSIINYLNALLNQNQISTKLEENNKIKVNKYKLIFDLLYSNSIGFSIDNHSLTCGE